ncbi:MAG: DUF4258 domain-containing protein [Candidatus Diapherotrites archaeon]|nr:DUF4258 domain-containing protein [Candidatus Diapherotrites archaeon]
MKYLLTGHAQERMHQRGVSLDLVIEVIEQAERIEKQKDTWIATKNTFKGRLEVVFQKTDTIIKIITTYWV